jgi:hypothetical protein
MEITGYRSLLTNLEIPCQLTNQTHNTRHPIGILTQLTGPGETNNERRIFIMVKVIAFYLPQFHPIPENDMFWEKDFTEWVNVRKAKPLYSPQIPTELGYYDLRSPETRKAQALLAATYGVDVFCYYHYWFAGKKVLELPFNEVLKSSEPNFPFALCWANQSWSGIWYGCPDQILIEQTYPGDEDFTSHFYSLLPAFRDSRYLKVDGKPVFVIFRPVEIPNKKRFTQLWQKLAVDNGLTGIYFIGFTWDLTWDHRSDGFNAAITQVGLPPAPKRASSKPIGMPTLFDATAIIERVAPKEVLANTLVFPCVLPNWDDTPRSGENGLVMVNSGPDNFKKQLNKAIEWTSGRPNNEKIIFIKAWNEWAEGNFMEPELRHGRGFLEALQAELIDARKRRNLT